MMSIVVSLVEKPVRLQKQNLQSALKRSSQNGPWQIEINFQNHEFS